MRDIKVLMGVERHGDCPEPIPAGIDQRGETLHVGVRAGHGQRRREPLSIGGKGPVVLGQVSEIVLRIDDQQVQVGHALLLMGPCRHATE